MLDCVDLFTLRSGGYYFLFLVTSDRVDTFESIRKVDNVPGLGNTMYSASEYIFHFKQNFETKF